MHKAYHGELPSLFDSFFIRNCDVHSHNTRQSTLHFNCPKVRTNYCKMSIRFRGPAVWNDIMNHKISPHVLSITFKNKLKDFFAAEKHIENKRKYE